MKIFGKRLLQDFSRAPQVRRSDSEFWLGHHADPTGLEAMPYQVQLPALDTPRTQLRDRTDLLWLNPLQSFK